MRGWSAASFGATRIEDPRTAPQPIGECNTPTGCLEVEALDELARVIGLSPWQAPPPDEPCAAKALKTNTRMASNWNAHVARAPASSEEASSRARRSSPSAARPTAPSAS